MATRLLRLLLPAVALVLAPVTVARAQVAADFTLRPGDVIAFAYWREPTLAGNYPVDERGEVRLPIIGVRVVTGVPWAALRDSLLAAYRRELSDPGVQLTPLRRVYVLGFVQRPGTYLADPATPIAGAIALAGGASTEGNPRKVRVLRDGETVLRGASVEASLMMADVQSGDQIIVDRRSWFDRNSPLVVSGLISITGIIVTLIVAR